WLIGKYANPYFTTAAHFTGHGDTGGFNLTGGNPAGLDGLQSIFAEVHAGAAFGGARAASALLLAVLCPFRHQHLILLPRLRAAARAFAAASADSGFWKPSDLLARHHIAEVQPTFDADGAIG